MRSAPPPPLCTHHTGTAGREINSSCTACSTQTTGYSFSWQFTDDYFASPALAKSLAADDTECIAQYSQLIDGAWYLPLKTQTNVSQNNDFVESINLF